MYHKSGTWIITYPNKYAYKSCRHKGHCLPIACLWPWQCSRIIAAVFIGQVMHLWSYHATSIFINLHPLFSDLLAQKRNKLRAGNPAGLRSPIASCFPPQSSGSVLKFDPYAICLPAFVQPLSKWIIRDIAGSSEPIALFDSCGTVCNIENPLMVSTFEVLLNMFCVFSKPKAKKIRNHTVGTSPTNPSFQENYWPLSRGIAAGHGHGRIWKKSSHKKKCRNPCGQNILSLWFSSYINIIIW